MPCWQQSALSHYKEDTGALNNVIYTTSINLLTSSEDCKFPYFHGHKSTVNGWKYGWIVAKMAWQVDRFLELQLHMASKVYWKGFGCAKKVIIPATTKSQTLNWATCVRLVNTSSTIDIVDDIWSVRRYAHFVSIFHCFYAHLTADIRVLHASKKLIVKVANLAEQTDKDDTGVVNARLASKYPP